MVDSVKSHLKFLAIIFFLNLSVALLASPQWALEDAKSGWNQDILVTTYFHNSELQRQWAWELMGKLPLEGNESVLDFGCGDGKISAEICRCVSQGSVTGVDISSEMINFAKIKFPSYAYPNLEFKQSVSLTFEDLPGEHSYDRIYSFCVFHQVANPVELLQNLKEHLKPKGKLVLLIPAGRNPVFFNAANEIFAKYHMEAPWKTPPTLSMRTLEGCSAILETSGYDVVSLEMIDTDNPFYDKAELVAWMVGTTTANWNIPPELSPAFFNALVERMCELDPAMVDEEGRVHFKLSRIHAVASGR